jgi:hypothetical protein
LRRLLVFGTGAAVIGIILTVVAFYESYLIVSSLQRDLGAATNQTVLLEESTLEAVFLGVMVALGYGLISKGLDGIRRQEMLELELPVEEMLRRDSNDARRNKSKSNIPQPKQRARVQVVKQTDGASSTVIQDAPVEQREQRVPSTPPPAQPRSVWQPSREPEVQSEPPMTATTASPQQLDTSEPIQASPEPVSESPAMEVPQCTPEAVKTDESNSEEMGWEGGPPPALEGVEVPPEPSVYGAQPAAFDSSTSTSQQTDSTSEQVQVNAQEASIIPVVAPKRKRGRPKGSKSAKAVNQENQESQESSSSG